MIEVKFKKAHEDAKLPIYSSDGAVGADVSSVEDVVIKQKETVLVDTGLDCRIPDGYEIQVRPRSGLALKHNITVINSPGTIDPDYTGKLKIMLHNLGSRGFQINKGDRIAQIVVAPITRATFSYTEEDKDTERGSGGFGSTGV